MVIHVLKDAPLLVEHVSALQARVRPVWYNIVRGVMLQVIRLGGLALQV